MSKRYPRAKWTLPIVINPFEDRCYLIRVPKENFHIAAFLGALQNLGSAQQWADDEFHTARQVARIWRNVIDNIEIVDCEPPEDCKSGIAAESPVGMWRQNGCKLEFSIDGECWCTIYDPTNCIQDTGGQPGPEDDLPAGECRQYDVRLYANQKWRLPITVSAGDRIRTFSATGGWNDGTAFWACPTGQPYILGACTGFANPADPGDPIQTAKHMALIGRYSTSGGFDALASTVLVPTGTVDANVDFQANDATLEDNSGDIRFIVEVCRAAVSIGCIACLDVGLTDQQAEQIEEDRWIFQVNASNVGGSDYALSVLWRDDCASALYCCVEMHINSLTFANPADGGVTSVQWLDCDDVAHSFTAGTSPDPNVLLEGVCLKNFFLRSDVPITMDVTITECP